MCAMESFVDINYADIEIIGVVGKGSFGVVSKGRWNNQDVAVKTIGSETEKKAFRIELRQLSRVNHENIVKLIGACQEKVVCLVMEYAEGGSLYNVLHGNPQPDYSSAHAVSWALQCARGVAYLHGMKPKALVHRDLKPPNLLLINGGTVLKICDFGTACDIHTHMTNNKGSAAWMAPEVFEGSSYSEKCDVFSWGIILWEVLTRQKPFDDIRGSAYQILWAVHSGKRPPPIRGCPEPLDILMKNCWNKEPHYRPSMEEVVTIMEELFGFFKGADQPIRYPPMTEGVVSDEDDDYDSENEDDLSDFDSREVTCGSECPSQVALETTSGSDQSTSKDVEPNQRGSTETLNAMNSSSIPSHLSRLIQSSAPASLASSKEDIQFELERTLSSGYPSSKEPDANRKRMSADISSLLKPVTRPHGHQRSGSYGSNFVVTNSEFVEPKGEDKRRNSEDTSRPRTQSLAVNPVYPPDVSLPPKTVNFNLNHPTNQPNIYSRWTPATAPSRPPPFEPSADDIKYTYLLLEPHLQPLSPYQGSRESLQVFEDHKKMACQYLRINKEVSLLKQRKNELDNYMNNFEQDLMHNQPDGNAIVNEYDNLIKEKESLRKLYENLQQQLAITRAQQKRQ